MLKKHLTGWSGAICLMCYLALALVTTFENGLRHFILTKMAEVFQNYLILSPFKLTGGTCQGCPLSPMLFVLAMEPFTIAVR